MTGFETALSAFHFLRPLVLLGLVPLAVIWWRVRRPDAPQSQASNVMAPHLQAALTIGLGDRARWQPIDLVALGLTLIIFAGSGPTWSRVPQPFAAQTAPMVIALKVTPSMTETDVAPSRLARAKQKIQDLLEMRAGARTALIAYSATAHSVVPMTEDGAVIQPYLEGLDPEVMPSEGDAPSAAMALALDMLAREDTPGGVLFLLDDMSLPEANSIAELAGSTPLAVLTLLPEGQEIAALSGLSARVVGVTPDTSDLRRLERGFEAAYRQAQLEDAAQPWQDRGAWLAWPAALLLLLWFRRGVSMVWGLLLAVWLTLPASEAQAEGWRDWFLTPDQQGWLAFRAKDYASAAEHFADPYLRGVAQYRSGQYEAAAQTFARIETADAAFAQGMAHIKSRGYRDGVRAFERALEIDPDHAGAKANLPVAKAIVTYVEETREQSDTGEESGIGADDVVFDNESGRGADTQIDAAQEDTPQHLSTEQWMNSVDTRTSDFLRQRFRLEAAEANQ
ncbi:VWA domain-containing protein [Shimia aestuarii]|uniref:Ca-activated chloride channel family protein n=1 Tax=Shimia aestuarii TaxID=254406 RepID=A0A1I4RN66_9RHOB|nr:VWA domain-containing protein [Shimia aestuarii]SFM53576.1 Ca-activated chloride channel family protein [Shimia aestuarii]